MIACENGHLKIVRLLVEKQANIGLKTKVHNTETVCSTVLFHSYTICYVYRRDKRV